MLPGSRHGGLTVMRTLLTYPLGRELQREQEAYGTPNYVYSSPIPDEHFLNYIF